MFLWVIVCAHSEPYCKLWCTTLLTIEVQRSKSSPTAVTGDYSVLGYSPSSKHKPNTLSSVYHHCAWAHAYVDPLLATDLIY